MSTFSSELAPSPDLSPPAARSAAPFRQRGWQRIEIAAGVELHVEDRRNLDPAGLARVVTALAAALMDSPGGPGGDR